MLKHTFFTVISCLLLTSAAQAEIYSWQDAAGNTQYSDQKPSADAKPDTSSQSANYYQPTKVKPAIKATASLLPATLDELSAEEDVTDGQPQLTEQQCQQNYNRSCEQVTNWQTYAKQRCGSDERCKDADFLERKYRPRSNDELREIALRAAVRNNNQQQKIALFLTKKYTNYCENQAEMLCRNKLASNCEATMQAYCEDPRDLNDIFRKYDNLSAIEKQAIISKAKQLATASGDQQLDYEQVLASLIEILISQAMLGI
jgi:hypothetical protein